MNSPWPGPLRRLSRRNSTSLSAKVGWPMSSSASSCRLKSKWEAQMDSTIGRNPEKMAGRATYTSLHVLFGWAVKRGFINICLPVDGPTYLLRWQQSPRKLINMISIMLLFLTSSPMRTKYTRIEHTSTIIGYPSAELDWWSSESAYSRNNTSNILLLYWLFRSGPATRITVSTTRAAIRELNNSISRVFTVNTVLFVLTFHYLKIGGVRISLSRNYFWGYTDESGNEHS